MKYKHIVFDIDGTLIDTEHAVLYSLQKTVKKLKNKDIEISDLRFALGIPGKDALLQLGFTDLENAIDLWDHYMRDYFHTVGIFDGIKDILDELKRKSYHLGIITSKSNLEYKNDFLPFGLAGYFDTVICADDTVEHKPNPEPMQKYLEIAKVSNNEAIYIGDSVYDMQCASKAGVDCALVLWGCNSATHINATYYLNEPKDILNLVD
ncbi:HAD family hydrolase [Oscillospiraceae bacterium PP1C4]